jgi:hypothetical protein
LQISPRIQSQIRKVFLCRVRALDGAIQENQRERSTVVGWSLQTRDSVWSWSLLLCVPQLLEEQIRRGGGRGGVSCLLGQLLVQAIRQRVWLLHLPCDCSIYHETEASITWVWYLQNYIWGSGIYHEAAASTVPKAVASTVLRGCSIHQVDVAFTIRQWHLLRGYYVQLIRGCGIYHVAVASTTRLWHLHEAVECTTKL